jgi:hypothetical protein
MGPAGDALTLFRSPPSVLDGCPPELSFGKWGVHDELPAYDDDVSSFSASAPCGNYVEVPEDVHGVPVHSPSHPSFPVSSVLIPISAVPSAIIDQAVQPSSLRPVFPSSDDVMPDSTGQSLAVEESKASEPRRSARTKVRSVPISNRGPRPVRDRWFYEPVIPALYAGLSDGTPGAQEDSGTMRSGASDSVASLVPHLGIRGDSEQSSGELMSSPQRSPPWSLRLTSAGPTGRFAIRLIFPGGELEDQVTTSMTVPTLAQAVARLMRVTSAVSMYVAPVWAPLNHPGFIVDRFLPGTDTPCPFLQPGSLVRVFCTETDNPGVRLVRFPDFSSSSENLITVGRQDVHRDLWDLASRPRLARLDAFSSSSESEFSIGRPLRNGEGEASITAR